MSVNSVIQDTRQMAPHPPEDEDVENSDQLDEYVRESNRRSAPPCDHVTFYKTNSRGELVEFLCTNSSGCPL